MSSFYAYLFRMKHLQRWSLMRNTAPENVQEHSLQVAQVAHALAVLRNARYGGGANPSRAAELALYHDAAEVITGDLPTPIKYFSDDLRHAYAQIESIASHKMLAMLPEDLRGAYQTLLTSPEEDAEWPRVKAADKLCAYLKCIAEERMGNDEFSMAKQTIEAALRDSPLPEVQDFLREFVPAFSVTLDELNQP